MHQIATYKELDKEFFKEKAFQFLEGNIDVSLLHCGLSTEQQVTEEEDTIWEWNKLFTEVVSILITNNEQDLTSNLTGSIFDNVNEKQFPIKKETGSAVIQTSRRERDRSSDMPL